MIVWLISHRTTRQTQPMATAAVLQAPQQPVPLLRTWDLALPIYVSFFLRAGSLLPPPQVLPQRVKWMNEQQSVSTLGTGI